MNGDASSEVRESQKQGSGESGVMRGQLASLLAAQDLRVGMAAVGKLSDERPTTAGQVEEVAK